MEINKITWSEAIEQAIVQLGYIATLKQIYEIAPKLKNFVGITPNKTINERVQRDSRFIKICPGLYGLRNHLDKIPDEYNPNIQKTEEENSIITHSYIQGMLIEIGNINGFRTFSPDKGGLFIKQKLGDITTLQTIPNFTFDKIIDSSKFIDVIWFNERQFPNNIFEVENSTNFRNSLVKFVELQDFATSMTMIAPNDKSKINKFQQEIEKSAFASIKSRVRFYDYDYIERLYNNQVAAQQFKTFFYNEN